jgi:RNA polymerase sigma-70 factor, ECF subfamily
MKAPRDLSSLTDQQLVAFALKRHQRAYDELLARHEAEVLGIATHHAGKKYAEDVKQEAFARAFRGLASYRPDLPFSTWLYRIAHNVAIDYVRKNEIETEPIEGAAWWNSGDLVGKPVQVRDPGRNPLQRAIRADRRRLLRECAERLQPKYRDCFVYRYLENLPYKEIATLMGISASVARTYAHRAVQTIKRNLDSRINIFDLTSSP